MPLLVALFALATTSFASVLLYNVTIGITPTPTISSSSVSSRSATPSTSLSSSLTASPSPSPSDVITLQNGMTLAPLPSSAAASSPASASATPIPLPTSRPSARLDPVMKPLSMQVSDFPLLAPLWDFFGGNTGAQYTVIGPIVHINAQPGCILSVSAPNDSPLPAAPSGDADDAVAAKVRELNRAFNSSILFANGPTMRENGCETGSRVIAQLPKLAKAVTDDLGLPAPMLFMLSAVEKSSEAFGGPEAERTDDYQLLPRPNGMHLAFIGSDTGDFISKSLAAASPSMAAIADVDTEAAGVIPALRIVVPAANQGMLVGVARREPGPWNAMHDSTLWTVLRLISIISNGLVIAYAAYHYGLLLLNFKDKRPLFKTFVFSAALYVIIISTIVRQGELTTRFLYTFCLVGWAFAIFIYNWILYKWMILMQKIWKYRWLYTMVLVTATLNMIVFEASILFLCVGIYPISTLVYRIGSILFAVANPLLFYIQAICILVAARMYMHVVRTISLTPTTKHNLIAITRLLYWMIFGWAIFATSIITSAAFVSHFPLLFFIKSFIYQTGVTVTYGAIFKILHMHPDGPLGPSRKGSAQSEKAAAATATTAGAVVASASAPFTFAAMAALAAGRALSNATTGSNGNGGNSGLKPMGATCGGAQEMSELAPVLINPSASVAGAAFIAQEQPPPQSSMASMTSTATPTADAINGSGYLSERYGFETNRVGPARRLWRRVTGFVLRRPQQQQQQQQQPVGGYQLPADPQTHEKPGLVYYHQQLPQPASSRASTSYTDIESSLPQLPRVQTKPSLSSMFNDGYTQYHQQHHQQQQQQMYSLQPQSSQPSLRQVSPKGLAPMPAKFQPTVASPRGTSPLHVAKHHQHHLQPLSPPTAALRSPTTAVGNCTGCGSIGCSGHGCGAFDYFHYGPTPMSAFGSNFPANIHRRGSDASTLHPGDNHQQHPHHYHSYDHMAPISPMRRRSFECAVSTLAAIAEAEGTDMHGDILAVMTPLDVLEDTVGSGHGIPQLPLTTLLEAAATVESMIPEHGAYLRVNTASPRNDQFDTAITIDSYEYRHHQDQQEDGVENRTAVVPNSPYRRRQPTASALTFGEPMSLEMPEVSPTVSAQSTDVINIDEESSNTH
ncbi:hypothetical protein GQ42DRAFT_154104 [Ramicandelaber brevisporus]|nr:hypothetical protein GQ42DRAFT_154104 [Ramicandelaber brevisporus]